VSRARVVYTDVDGTLVGPRGCFFRDPEGATSLAPARALVDLLDAGVALVLVSGRSLAQLVEAAALVGADGVIAELGGLVGWTEGRRRRVERLPTAGPPAAPALVEALTAAFDLALYEPWHAGHEVDVLLRGHADPEEVHAWLAGRGAPHLRLRDNGVLPGSGHTVFHLLPDGVSKGAAVSWDLRRRGLEAGDAAAVGDSVSDLEMAPAVGRFFLVANGAAGVGPGGMPRNATVTAGAMGLGFAEAVRAALGG